MCLCSPAARLWGLTSDQVPSRLSGLVEEWKTLSLPCAAQGLIGKQHMLHTSRHHAPLRKGSQSWLLPRVRCSAAHGQMQLQGGKYTNDVW